MPAVAITILFGSVTFSALAYALAPSIRSSTAIQPIIQLILLPLYAISGVLLPNSKNPDWLNEVASVLPLQHLAHGLHHAFDPTTHGIGLSIVDLAVLSAWSVAALVLATATVHLAAREWLVSREHLVVRNTERVVSQRPRLYLNQEKRTKGGADRGRPSCVQ